jgi:hypothetical protein
MSSLTNMRFLLGIERVKIGCSGQKPLPNGWETLTNRLNWQAAKIKCQILLFMVGD